MGGWRGGGLSCAVHPELCRRDGGRPHGSPLHTYTTADGLPSDNVTSIVEDDAGRLWVGTFESGVSRLGADGTTWELVNAFDGLPVDSVTTMTVAGDTLWIGTRGGIALWDGRKVLGSLPDGNGRAPSPAIHVVGGARKR